jgi:hypothetical protein
MAAPAVVPRHSLRRQASAVPGVPATRAVAYQRVLHQLVRRELRLLADLATWAPADDAHRTAALTRHADLIGRVLLQHHATERDLLWPALRRSVPAHRAASLEQQLADWAERCRRIDSMLRDLSTAARQWTVALSAHARDTFAVACLDLADAVEEQTAEEERSLLPLLGEHLPPATWHEITRSVRSDLSASERMFVLGLALEDACTGDRERLLSGLPPRRRLAWRLRGRGAYRSAVVRLRGAPPAV